MCTVYKPELHAARVYIQMAKAWTMYVTSISGNVEHDVVEAYATAADFLWGIWAIMQQEGGW